MTGDYLNGFLLLNLIGITLRVGIGVISKELSGSFVVDGLGWSLSLGIDGDM